MRFFVDNNLGPDLAAGLRGFGEDVVHLRDYFEVDAADVDWLGHIGEQGWYLITRDDAIRRKPFEIAVLRRHTVGAFFLGGKNLARCELIEQIIRNWRRIKMKADESTRPFGFRVPPRGMKIKRLF